MNTIKILGKYLDQPLLIAKFKKKVPIILTSGAAYFAYKDIKNEENRLEQKKKAIKIGSVFALTIASALAAPKVANKIFKTSEKSIKNIKFELNDVCDKFIKNNSQLDEETLKIVNKSKSKILKFKEIKHLFNNLEKKENGQQFLEKLIPNPENITSKEIFSEIGRLSLLGFIPVLGGITGGIIGDKLTENNWKDFVPNKVKEGAYQYLANIFLCNVGAGAALALMEKGHVKSKNTRAFGMVGGILATGVIGGSAIANFIGNKIINPIFGNKSSSNIYSERKPEALDIGLHVDDIATVAVMSGLKWIEPALPIMYAISGYRAGIGYRNGKTSEQ